MNFKLTLLCIFIYSVLIFSDTVYVDLRLPHTYNSYKPDTTYYSLSGNKKAYNSIQKAIDSTPTGMTVILRGGIYQQNHIRLWTSKNGTSWTPGNYNTLQSMDGEWAIIDGKNEVYNRNNINDTTRGCPLIGSGGGGQTPAIKYWKMSRIEITGGKSKFQDGAGGFGADVGPFWFTHCYIHDNKAMSGSQNPTGIGGYVWNNSIVEYCLFKSNGSSANDQNSADITILSDYNMSATGWAKTGFTFTEYTHIYKNTFRYNLFLGNSGTHIKYKGAQLLTGRNPAEGHPLDDTYKDYGDLIHHNIFMGSALVSSRIRIDFAQIYNNIFKDCGGGIGYDPGESSQYKMAIYNNTLINSGGIATPHSHYYPDSLGQNKFFEYAYNNIIQGGQAASSDGSSLSSWRTGDYPLANFDDFKISNNLFYKQKVSTNDPSATHPIFIGSTVNGPNPYYTTLRFASEFDPTSVNWLNDFPGLFLGTEGATQYITSETFALGNGKTLANLGKGGDHPYLPGVKIPVYIGATDPGDPNKSQWVYDVLSLENLKNVGPKRPPVFSKVPTPQSSALFADSVKKNFTWEVTADSKITACSLFVSLDSLKTWRLLNVVKDSFTYYWKLPDTVTTKAFLKVVALDADGLNSSAISNRFSIINQISIVKKTLVRGAINKTYIDTLLTKSGIPPCRWVITKGFLPASLALDSLTGIIAGTAYTAGKYPFTVKMADFEHHTAEDTFAIVIDSLNPNEIKITNPTIAGGPVFFADSTKHTVSWTATAYNSIALCSLYISLDSAHSWVPVTGTNGRTSQYQWAVTNTNAKICYMKVIAKDESGNTATGISTPFSIINSISIRKDSLPATVTGLYYHQQLQAVSGIPPYRWAITSGKLPDGISLDSLTGIIVGAAKLPGTYGFIVLLKDAGNHTATNTFIIGVDSIADGSILISPPRISDRGIVYADSIKKNFSWSIVSSVKIANCSLFVSLDSMKQWHIIDTVAPGVDKYLWRLPDTSVKNCFLKVKAVNDSGTSASAISLPFEIINYISIKTKILAPGIQNRYYREALLVDAGIPPFTWSIIKGSLPPGPLLDSLTGIIFGVPDSSGTFGMTVRLTDGEHHTVDAELTLTINQLILGKNLLLSTSIKNEIIAGNGVTDTFRLVNYNLKLSYDVYAGSGNEKAVKIPTSLITLSDGSKALVINIPGSAVNDTTGLRAFIVIGNDTLFDTVSIAHPVKRQINNFDNVIADSLVWTPLSVTATPEKNDIASVLSVFRKEGSEWDFDKTKFRIIQWFPSPATIDNTVQWLEGTQSNKSLFSFAPGKLFWIRTAKKTVFDFGSAVITPLDPSKPVAITLNKQQWTDFSLPFAFPIKLAAVLDATKSKLVANKVRVDDLELYAWKKENSTYKAHLVFADSVVLIDKLFGGPGTGYTIYNSGEPFQLAIPSTSTQSATLKKTNLASNNTSGFRVNFNFEGEHGGANPIIFSSSPQCAKTTFLREPPALGSSRIALVDSDTRKRYGHLFTNELPDGGIVLTFFANNRISIDEKIKASFTTVGTFPENYSIRFFNEQTNSFSPSGTPQQINLAAHDSLQFIAGIGNSTFFSKMGLSLSAHSIALDQVYQIPHSSNLLVKYSLSNLAGNIREISFELIALNGRVAKKFHTSSGFTSGENHLVIDLKSRDGKRMSSAIYFLKMTVTGNVTRNVFVKKVLTLN